MNMDFKELVLGTDKLLIQRWAKDYKVPIAYFEENYLTYALGRLANYRPE